MLHKMNFKLRFCCYQRITYSRKCPRFNNMGSLLKKLYKHINVEWKKNCPRGRGPKAIWRLLMNHLISLELVDRFELCPVTHIFHLRRTVCELDKTFKAVMRRRATFVCLRSSLTRAERGSRWWMNVESPVYEFIFAFLFVNEYKEYEYVGKRALNIPGTACVSRETEPIHPLEKCCSAFRATWWFEPKLERITLKKKRSLSPSNEHCHFKKSLSLTWVVSSIWKGTRVFSGGVNEIRLETMQQIWKDSFCLMCELRTCSAFTN